MTEFELRPSYTIKIPCPSMQTPINNYFVFVCGLFFFLSSQLSAKYRPQLERKKLTYSFFFLSSYLNNLFLSTATCRWKVSLLRNRWFVQVTHVCKFSCGRVHDYTIYLMEIKFGINKRRYRFLNRIVLVKSSITVSQSECWWRGKGVTLTVLSDGC